jgi:hypothetical protein
MLRAPPSIVEATEIKPEQQPDPISTFGEAG